MAVTKQGTVRLSSGAVTINATDDKGFNRGDLGAPPGMEDAFFPYGLLFATVAVTAAAGGPAMTTAEVKGALSAVKGTLFTGGAREEAQHIPFKAEPLHIFQLAARTDVERNIIGLTDTADGLGKVLTAGTHVLNFQLVVPFGDQEAWLGRPSMGMGYDQLRKTGFHFKRAGIGDTLNAVNANLTLGNFTFEMWGEPKRLSSGRLWCYGAEVRHTKFSSDNATKELELGRGLPSRVTELSATNANTLLQGLNVRVGAWYMNRSPGTPKTFNATYTAKPDVGATETTADTYTNVLAYPDIRFRDLPTGAVVVQQVDANLTAGEYLASIYKVQTEAELRRDMELVLEDLGPGDSVKSVYNASVEGADVLPNHIPFGGVRHFIKRPSNPRESDRDFDVYPGYVATKVQGGETEFRVDIPPQHLVTVASAYRTARDIGDAAAQESALQRLWAFVAGSIGGTEGFESGRTAIANETADQVVKVALAA